MPGIPVHHTTTSEASWDGPGNVARADSDRDYTYYRRIFAWRDPDGDESTKSAYKFPHHEVDGDGNPSAANVKGCQSGIGVLNGARGGADIPGGDRQGVWSHLAAHLRDADVEPAELRQMEPARVIVPPYGGDVERRTVQLREVRVVERDGDTEPRIEGYAAVFGQYSEDLGGFREQIEPGAFAKTIGESDVRALWNHNTDYVLGRSKSKTLSLREDDTGLRISITPPDTSWANDLMVSMKRGDVDQMSFGFETVRESWVQDENGEVTRVLLEVKLFDVSPVTFPAYPQTSAQVRSKVSELQSAEPPEAGHPEDGDDDTTPRARVDVLRRQVDLAESRI